MIHFHFFLTLSIIFIFKIHIYIIRVLSFFTWKYHLCKRCFPILLIYALMIFSICNLVTLPSKKFAKIALRKFRAAIIPLLGFWGKTILRIQSTMTFFNHPIFLKLKTHRGLIFILIIINIFRYLVYIILIRWC